MVAFLFLVVTVTCLTAPPLAGGERDFQSDYPQVNVLSDKNYVIDDKVLTSNGSLVSYQAALKLLNLMSSPSKAEEVADALQYSRFSNQSF
ncbi:hypothetical protein [Vibrio coralliilyticus]|uniref:hypothetical protein n=1 Tax=Vibrio coralliilyticus TaxID=190893 RepID=UPI0020A34203|nr:hypothetical protein [Vibrio coralliilyticus]